MADHDRPPKGLLITGIVVLLLGVGGCGFGGFTGARLINELTSSVSNTEPNAFGEAFVFTATGVAALVVTSERGLCEATDGSGARVELSDAPDGLNPNLGGGEADYTGGFSMKTVDGRSYEVICNGPNVDGTFLVVPLPGGVAGIVGSVGSLFGGGLLILLGISLTIGGLIAQSRWKKRTGLGGSAAQTGVVPIPTGIVTRGEPPPPIPPSVPGAPSAPSVPGAPGAPGAPIPPGAPDLPQTPMAPPSSSSGPGAPQMPSGPPTFPSAQPPTS